MLSHYLAAALRNLARFKLATAINILGLALGLACFIAAYAAITWLRAGDLFLPNTQRVLIIAERVRVQQLGLDTGFQVRSSPPVAKYLPIDFPELEAVARLSGAGSMSVGAGETHAYLKSAVSQPELLEILALPFVERTTQNPLAEPRGAVLTHAAAVKLFGAQSALGRRVVLHGKLDVTVTGVLKDIPQPSHVGSDGTALINFDVLINRESEVALRTAIDGVAPQERSESLQWANNGAITYALLPKAGSPSLAEINARFADFARRRLPAESRGLNLEFQALPLASVRLANLDATLFRGKGLSLTSLTLALAWLILGIACINYANLSVAQTLVRYRELGVRRVLGAARRQLMMHYTVEAILQTVVALVVAFGMVISVAQVLFPDQAPAWIATVARRVPMWGTILALTLLVSFLIAAYPALAASSAQPAQVMRGSSLRSGRGFAARFFVGVQFAATSLMLIGLIVVHLQNANMRSHALQQMADPTVVLTVDLKAAGVSYETLKNELQRWPGVVAVSAMNVPPWFEGGGITTISRDAEFATKLTPIINSVRYDFEKAFGMVLLAGRSFSKVAGDRAWPEFLGALEAGEYGGVIDRSLARALGWNDPSAAVGQVIHYPSNAKDGTPIPVRVLGVIEDKPLRLEVLGGGRANMYILSQQASVVAIRIRVDQIAQALKSIDATWQRLAPQVPVQRKFMDEFFEQRFATFALVGRMLTLMTVIGAGIAAMGLFAFAVFVANRRTHEIGVRKTMGARTTQVLAMLLKDFSSPILWANLLVWPLAYFFAQRYLTTFVDRITLDAWPFILSLLATLIVAWLAVASRALRTSRVKPAEVLRYE